ncbi:discoidin domain-containing protein [Kitasatospora sp. NPDC050543]|uniref:discoidin domain-containing protein n=1 Tax=Kitasatospora sp. NPDC050543 TaxID=3364054 RepID=UPI00378B4B19
MTLVVQMQDAGIAASDPLLSYTVTTTPSPLKASPENPQAPEEIGEIVIAVSRQSGTPADVKSIRLQVPAGTMSPDLATDLAKVTPRISLTGWTGRLEAADKEFVFTPAASHTPIGPDLGFTIQLSDIPMSRKVGTAPITLTEESRTGTSAFQDRETVFNIGKFPADFYLRNFLCEPSIVQNGGDVKLTWERSANATYELLYPGVSRWVTDRTSLELEGIKSDTTFYLRATTGDPSNPVVRILSTQVTVLKPDLDIGNLTVNGNVTISGALTATTVTARKTLTAGLPTASALPEGIIGRATADKMLDGRDDTFYQSRLIPHRDDWAMVDLGEVRRITGIEIHFTTSVAPGRVETSTDQTNWTSRGDATAPVYSHTFPNGGAEVRYVRFLVTKVPSVVFQIRHFIVTPGVAFTAGIGSSGTLGVAQTSGDAQS